MHDDLKRRLREEVAAELGRRPPSDLTAVLSRGRSKRLALRLVTTMSMILLGIAVVAGGLWIGQTISSPSEDGRRIQPADDEASPSEPTPSETPQSGEASGWAPDILDEPLDGKVSFYAPSRWTQSPAGPWALWLNHKSEERIYVLVDPLPIGTGCQAGPPPADAEALARSIRSDPDLEATEPVVVSVGGVEALRMDVMAANGASGCRGDVPGVMRAANTEKVMKVQETIIIGGGHFPVSRGGRHRMQLYLLDVPGSARILAIAIVAPEDRFERVVEEAAPVLDSFEFRTAEDQ